MSKFKTLAITTPVPWGFIHVYFRSSPVYCKNRFCKWCRSTTILLALLKVWDAFAAEGFTSNPSFLSQQIVQVAHPLPEENYAVPLQGKVTSSWDDIPMPRSSERVFSIFHTSRSQWLQKGLVSVSQSLFLYWWPFRALEEGRFLTSRFLARSYPRKPVSWTPLLLARSIFPPTEGLSDHLPCNLSDLAVLFRYSFLPRRWKQHVPLQRW
jgi:hypothetical protein